MGLLVPVLMVVGFIVHTVLLEMVAYPLAASHFYPGHPNGRIVVIALQSWIPGTSLLLVASCVGFAIWRIGKSLAPDARWFFLSMQTWGKIVAGFGVVFILIMLTQDPMVRIKQERFVDKCGVWDQRLDAQGCSCVRSFLESEWPAELYIPFYTVAEDYLREPAEGDAAMRRLAAWYETKPGVAPGKMQADLAGAVRFGVKCQRDAEARRQARVAAAQGAGGPP